MKCDRFHSCPLGTLEGWESAESSDGRGRFFFSGFFFHSHILDLFCPRAGLCHKLHLHPDSLGEFPLWRWVKFKEDADTNLLQIKCRNWESERRVVFDSLTHEMFFLVGTKTRSSTRLIRQGAKSDCSDSKTAPFLVFSVYGSDLIFLKRPIATFFVPAFFQIKRYCAAFASHS